jgi:hypothetical protein
LAVGSWEWLGVGSWEVKVKAAVYFFAAAASSARAPLRILNSE